MLKKSKNRPFAKEVWGQSDGGFTFIEIIVSIFLLGVSTVAITGLAVVGTRTSFESERQNVALGVVNEKIEIMRSLAYDDVGILGSDPEGILLPEETVARNEQDYVVNVEVENIDDEANGTLPPGTLNETTADYKKVAISANWTTAAGNARDVSVVTYVTPGIVYCTPGELTCLVRGIDQDSNTCVPQAGGTGPGSINTSPNPSATPYFDGTMGGFVFGQPPSINTQYVECPATGICPVGTMAALGGNASVGYCPPGALYCPECYNNSQCVSGQVCDTTAGECVAAAGACRVDGDCASGEVCAFGQCQADCRTNGCGGSLVCNQATGACNIPCTDNQCSCAPGSQCNTGTGFCDLPPISSPAPGASSPPSPPCEDAADCSGGAACNSAGDCVPPCTDNSQCGGGVCDPTTGACEPCIDDGDCGGGNTCFVAYENSGSGSVGPGGSACLPPCSSHSDCGAGEACVSTANGSICDPAPGNPCTDDGECGNGMSCGSSGSCEPDWCVPPDAEIICPDFTIDPGCSACGGGRIVIEMVEGENSSTDPQCNTLIVSTCTFSQQWVPCGECSPTPPPTSPPPPDPEPDECTENNTTPDDPAPGESGECSGAGLGRYCIDGQCCGYPGPPCPSPSIDPSPIDPSPSLDPSIDPSPSDDPTGSPEPSFIPSPQ